MDIPRKYFEDTLSVLKVAAEVNSFKFSLVEFGALNAVKTVHFNLKKLLLDNQSDLLSVNELSKIINELQTIYANHKESTGFLGFGEKISPPFCAIYVGNAIKDIQIYKEKAISSQINIENIDKKMESLRKEQEQQAKINTESLEKKLTSLQEQQEQQKKKQQEQEKIQQEQEEKQRQQAEKINAMHALLPVFRRLDLGLLTPEQVQHLQLICGDQGLPQYQLQLDSSPNPNSKNPMFFTTKVEVKSLDPKYKAGFDQIPKVKENVEEWKKENAENLKIYDRRKVKSCISDSAYALIFELTVLDLQSVEKALASKMIYWLLDISLVENEVYQACSWADKITLLKQQFAVNNYPQLEQLLNASLKSQYEDLLPSRLKLNTRFQTLSKPAKEGYFLPENEEASKRYAKDKVEYTLQKEKWPANMM